MQREISIIIPQYGHVELTIQSVESLLKFHRDCSSFEIIIVDDGSPTPELLQLQRQAYPKTVLLRNAKNLGVTHAWNYGAAYASGKIVIFLNNDTITHGQWLSTLAGAVHYRKHLIAGPEIRSEPLIPPFCHTSFPDRKMLSGWCFAISRELFRSLDGFDNRFRLFYSDTDLQLRIAEQNHSLPVISLVPDLPISHSLHQTTIRIRTRSEQWKADQAAFKKKWNV